MVGATRFACRRSLGKAARSWMSASVNHGGDQHACAVDEDAAMFLAALVSFYNSDPAGSSCDPFGANGLSGIAARLDESRRQVIANLLLAYPGW